jgi:uncharacterized FlaG/YvyC family protein
MTIESLASDRNSKIADALAAVTPAAPLSAQSALAAPVVSAAPITKSSAPANDAAVTAAVGQLQSAISQSPNPDFKLDYLSGLSVVTVRSTLTGEVVFQLPDTRALELARMIKDGASVGSLGLYKTTA